MWAATSERKTPASRYRLLVKFDRPIFLSSRQASRSRLRKRMMVRLWFCNSWAVKKYGPSYLAGIGISPFQPDLSPLTSHNAVTVLGRIDRIDNEHMIAGTWRSEQTVRSRRGPLT